MHPVIAIMAAAKEPLSPHIAEFVGFMAVGVVLGILVAIIRAIIR